MARWPWWVGQAGIGILVYRWWGVVFLCGEMGENERREML